MSEWVIIGWVVFVVVLALNGTSAGVAALLHCWPGRLGRGSRILLAGFAAGALPTSFLVIVPLADPGVGQPSYWVAAVAVVLAVGSAASLPAAVVVTRKLAKPGEEYRAFE